MLKFSIVKFLFFLWLYFIFNVILFLWFIIDSKISTTLSTEQKLDWYNHQETNEELKSFWNFEIEKSLVSECEPWFQEKDFKSVYCKWKILYTFNKKELPLLEILEENMELVLFWTILILLYFKLVFPNLYNIRDPYSNKNVFTNIDEKIRGYKEVTSEDLYKLESYVFYSYKNYPKNYYFDLENLYILEKNARLKWNKEISKQIRIIQEKLKRKYYLSQWKILKWLGNVFSYMTSIYLTNIFVFFIFLAVFIFYNSLLFKYLFYFSSWWTFLESNFWYIYETINITSNLGWNTDATNIIQEVFLAYLTVSWVVIFWLLLAIINERINLR